MVSFHVLACIEVPNHSVAVLVGFLMGFQMFSKEPNVITNENKRKPSWLSTCLTFKMFSLNRPLGLFSLLVAMSVCHVLSPPGNHASGWTRDLWSKSVSLILPNWKKGYFTGGLMIYWKEEEEKIRGGCLGVLVHSGEVSRGRKCGCGCWRRWQVIRNTRHATIDTWHYIFFLFAQLERLSVSRMRDYSLSFQG